MPNKDDILDLTDKLFAFQQKLALIVLLASVAVSLKQARVAEIKH
jgi:hypothetical protein